MNNRAAPHRRRMLPCLALCAVVCLAGLSANGAKEADSAAHRRSTVITIDLWSEADAAALSEVFEEYRTLEPHTRADIRTLPRESYDDVFELRLDSGTGADLLYVRPYAAGQEFFASGLIADCTDIPGLMANVTDEQRSPWQDKDGRAFAVPVSVVSHGVYYSKTVFEHERLAVPRTWEEFLTLCGTLKELGYVPLANGSGDGSLLECLFLPILANYTGGSEGRLQYESGERALNDVRAAAAFQALRDAAAFCPHSFDTLSYEESRSLFTNGEAVMIADGSWNLSEYGAAAFEWGVFALPAPSGSETIVCVQPDAAIALNAASAEQEAARAFLSWLCSIEGGRTLAEHLPAGRFPAVNFPLAAQDAHADEFMKLHETHKTDVRFIYPQCMHVSDAMREAAAAAMRGEMTAQQAADAVCDALSG